MLTEHEAAARNLDLESEFEKHLVHNPPLLEHIPQDAHVVLLPLYDRELYDYNLGLGDKIAREGGRVVYVKVGSLADTVPPSRLREVSIDLVA